MRSTRGGPPVPIFDQWGLSVMVGSGAQFRSGLATTYVWLPETSEVRLTSCPLVQSLTVFILLKVAGPTGRQIRWPHLRSDWRPR